MSRKETKTVSSFTVCRVHTLARSWRRASPRARCIDPSSGCTPMRTCCSGTCAARCTRAMLLALAVARESSLPTRHQTTAPPASRRAASPRRSSRTSRSGRVETRWAEGGSGPPRGGVGGRRGGRGGSSARDGLRVRVKLPAPPRPEEDCAGAVSEGGGGDATRRR